MNVQTKPAPPKSFERKLWDALIGEMNLDRKARPTGAVLRNYHFAGRSVIWPRTALPIFKSGRLCNAPPHERIIAHVARTKTRSEEWQQISLAWLAQEIRVPVIMDLMVGELIEHMPAGVSLVGFSDQSWLCAALVEQGFKAVSPNHPDLPEMHVPPASACYVLRR